MLKLENCMILLVSKKYSDQSTESGVHYICGSLYLWFQTKVHVFHNDFLQDYSPCKPIIHPDYCDQT